MSINLIMIYDALYLTYGDIRWWPADTPYEMMIGAVLTQNTAWRNVERAIANFGGDMTPMRVANMPIDELIDIIRPSGFFNQKSAYVKALTAWYKRYDYNIETAAKSPLSLLRAELLTIKGIGRETADSILLYALNQPSFVVDAYTKRLLTRLNIPHKNDYESIKALFEGALPRDVYLYNNYHALIVENAKVHCRAKPLCSGCPLCDMCARSGG